MRTATPPIQLRDARAEDVPILASFNRRLAHETEGLELAEEVVERGVQAVLENSAHGFYLLAEIQTEVVGSLMVTREWSDWRARQWWWIQSVYVAKKWRRRGIYRILYAQVRRMASLRAEVCGVRLYVAGDNATAQQTYAALGMRPTGYQIFEHAIERKPD